MTILHWDEEWRVKDTAGRVWRGLRRKWPRSHIRTQQLVADKWVDDKTGPCGFITFVNWPLDMTDIQRELAKPSSYD